MEGRLTAATAELDSAMESAAAAANSSADGDIETALSGTPFAPNAVPPSPSRDDVAAAAEWRYGHHFDPLIDPTEAGVSQAQAANAAASFNPAAQPSVSTSIGSNMLDDLREQPTSEQPSAGTPRLGHDESSWEGRGGGRGGALPVAAGGVGSLRMPPVL